MVELLVLLAIVEPASGSGHVEVLFVDDDCGMSLGVRHKAFHVLQDTAPSSFRDGPAVSGISEDSEVSESP
jgi:hypothetical protein